MLKPCVLIHLPVCDHFGVPKQSPSRIRHSSSHTQGTATVPKGVTPAVNSLHKRETVVGDPLNQDTEKTAPRRSDCVEGVQDLSFLGIMPVGNPC